MAKTLTEQVNLPASSGTISTGGAGAHSLWARDLPRALNNLATYIEPSFQFLMDASDTGSSGAGPQQQLGRVWISGDPSSGTMFLAQAPILLPVQAKRLLWTMGFTRTNADPEATTVGLDVVGVDLYLSNAPYRGPTPGTSFVPTDNAGLGIARTNSNFPAFQEGLMQPGYTKRTITSGSIQNGANNSPVGPAPLSLPIYGFIDDTASGWTNFLPSTVDQSSESVAWMIVTASFQNAAVDNGVFIKEFSIWGQYE